MPNLHAAFLVLCTIGFWALRNRARGWGDGWAGTQNPKWLLWVQEHIFNRYLLAIAGAIPIAAWCHYLGYDDATVWQVSGIVAVGWFIGVVIGIGDYQDMRKIPNREIGWIDATVQPFLTWLGTWLVWQHRILAAWAPAVTRLSNSAVEVDNISMGLRGAYMLPMFIALGFALEGWAGFYWPMLLPIAFFWQQGLIYHWCKKIKGDYVLWCELLDDALRCALLLAALLMGGI